MDTQSSIILTEKYYNMEVIEKLLSVNTTLPGYDDTMMWTNEQNKLREIKTIRLMVVKQLSTNKRNIVLDVCTQFLLKIPINQCIT